MTKKAKKVKVTRKSKQSALTVAQTLKQLPKLFKKEISALKDNDQNMSVRSAAMDYFLEDKK